jgi:hypothetical protein
MKPDRGELRAGKMKITVLTFFAISMAYVEAMVVVYLRRMLPLEGLAKASLQEVTMRLQEHNIYFEEQSREAATIVMLVAVTLVSAKGLRERCAVFLWCFALWDLFYYLFLYLWTGWPQSLLDPDILFLIPIPWLAPVIFPIAISTVMAGTALVLFSFHPETPDEKLLVFNSESRIFSSWQGNQGVARRRTSVRRTSKLED